MSTITQVAICTVVLATTSMPAVAEFDARPYHDQHCTRCHDTGVYTREDRRVRSFPALEAQVARCDAALATKLFPDDLKLLVDHLNSEYYKFAK
jgi:hypothetical protein